MLSKRNTITPKYLSDRRDFSRLKVARIAMGLTQQELSELSGVSRRRIVTLEQGKGQPRRVTAVALAAVLQVEVSDLWPDLITTNEKESDK